MAKKNDNKALEAKIIELADKLAQCESAFKESEEQNSKLNTENEQLKSEIETLTKNCNDALNELNRVKGEKYDLEQMLDNIGTDIKPDTEEQPKRTRIVALTRFNGKNQGEAFSAKQADADKWIESGLAVLEEDYEEPDEKDEEPE